MQSHVDQISPVLVEIKVEVPWTKVNENLEGAYRTLQRTARVRGFRQGKVPRNVVKNLMGKSVQREVTQRLVEEALAEAVTTHALDPVAMSAMDTPPELTEGQAFSFSAKLEVKPKIDKVEMVGLAVNRNVTAITDADVEREVERLREQNAELVAPDPPRPAAGGDVLALKIEVSVEGTPRPDLASEDSRAELGSGRLLAELETGLHGASRDEEREISLTFPEDYGHDELRGKAAVFKVKVKEIFHKVLPAIDDDMARDLDHESLEAMRSTLRKQLEGEATRKADAEMREALVDKLIDANPVPVPPTLLERQQQSMMRELFQLQQMLGRPLPMDDSMHHEMQERAERRIRAGLLFGAIAEQEKIDVSAEDVETRLAEIAAQSGKHVAKVRAEYQGERRESLQSQILQNKLLEYLVSRATITDGPAEPPKAAVTADKHEHEPESAKPSSEDDAGQTAAVTTEPAAKPKAPRKRKAATSGKDEG
jgi:trigger factor